MRGTREEVVSADGTRIGLLTAGAGAPLLLVHGGMTDLRRWAPVWPALADRYLVAAMDRRGRGGSGDRQPYRLDAEFDDVRAAVEHLHRRAGRPVDVFAHSYGAVCALGAAARGAPARRLALYEPPGPQTVAGGWLERFTSLIAAGDAGRAAAMFLIEVIGMPVAQVIAMRDTPVAEEAIRIVTHTMPREGRALAVLDLPALAAAVPQPVLLVLGALSPPWASAVTEQLRQRLPDPTVAVLAGQGHEAIDGAPAAVVDLLRNFFG